MQTLSFPWVGSSVLNSGMLNNASQTQTCTDSTEAVFRRHASGISSHDLLSGFNVFLGPCQQHGRPPRKTLGPSLSGAGREWSCFAELRRAARRPNTGSSLSERKRSERSENAWSHCSTSLQLGRRRTSSHSGCAGGDAPAGFRCRDASLPGWQDTASSAASLGPAL